VGTFLIEGQVVPHHVGILQVGLRVSLLGVDEVGELARVTDEEHRGVIAYHVPIPFFSVEFYRESTGVTFGVRATFFTTYG
jgi:hypothetical protein